MFLCSHLHLPDFYIVVSLFVLYFFTFINNTPEAKSYQEHLEYFLLHEIYLGRQR